MKKRKPKPAIENGESIKSIVKKAAEAGMSYGEYVAYADGINRRPCTVKRSPKKRAVASK